MVWGGREGAICGCMNMHGEGCRSGFCQAMMPGEDLAHVQYGSPGMRCMVTSIHTGAYLRGLAGLEVVASAGDTARVAQFIEPRSKLDLLRKAQGVSSTIERLGLGTDGLAPVVAPAHCRTVHFFREAAGFFFADLRRVRGVCNRSGVLALSSGSWSWRMTLSNDL